MPLPPPVAEVEPVPTGRTARRLHWQHLPPPVRAAVERRLGSPVADACSQDAGFTPGLASRLTAEDGTRLFVKAASRKAQPQIAASYAEEARKLVLLPAGLPAPALRWSEEVADWVVLGLEDVEARNPARPWRDAELERCLQTLVDVDALLGPEVAAAVGAKPLHEELPELIGGWDVVRQHDPATPHLDELEELARSYVDLPDADHLAHSDARDDNFLLAADGRTLICDWNWPALAPGWIDAVDLLVTAHGDGLDADAWLARCPLTAELPADHVDVWLAALLGYMLAADTRPVPASSPHLGVHRRWWAAALWSWLSRRRGWA